MSLIIMAKIIELHYELISHPPYSIDLSPLPSSLSSQIVSETNAQFRNCIFGQPKEVDKPLDKVY